MKSGIKITGLIKSGDQHIVIEKRGKWQPRKFWREM
jgi:hypothetical protein